MEVTRLELVRATNGGWVVTDGGSDRGLIPQVRAAYSTTGDMLTGLADMLGPRNGSRTAFVDDAGTVVGRVRGAE